MLCIQNIQTGQQPLQHSQSCPLTVFLQQQCFWPNTLHFDAVHAVAVVSVAAVLLAAVWAWCLLAQLVGQLAACGLVLQLKWTAVSLVVLLHPVPFAVQLVWALQLEVVGLVVVLVGVGA